MKRQSSLDRLLEGLSHAPHDYRPGTDTFPDLDPKKVAKELELEGRGKERSFRGEPIRPQGQLDDIEMEIIETIESEKKHAHQIVEEQLQSYARRLASLDFEGRLTAIHQTAPDCIMEFRAERAKGEDSLHALRRALIEHEAERDDFRTRHRLRRPARTHSPAVAFLKWGILVLLLAVECAVNGSFLAKSNELGWIGGISEALAFAALNVGGAFAAATLGARLLTHRNWFLKCVGAVGVAVWLCLTLLLNLALAHYREVAGTLVSQGGQEVISRLRATPFELGDIQSWILFGIGALFAVAAFVDSLLLYDPYWGYGSLERRLSKAREQYKALKADLVDDLRDIYSDYSQKLGEIGQDLSARLGEYDRIVSARNGKLELFGAHQGQLENASNTLLGIYRSARGIHGNNLYKLARINVMVDNPDKRQRDEIERTVRDAQAVLRTQAGLLQRECQAGIERYDQIDSLVGNRKERNDASA